MLWAASRPCSPGALDLFDPATAFSLTETMVHFEVKTETAHKDKKIGDCKIKGEEDLFMIPFGDFRVRHRCTYSFGVHVSHKI